MDVELIWKNCTARLPGARRIDVAAEVARVDQQCAYDAADLLGPWLVLSDECLRFLLVLLELCEDAVETVKDRTAAMIFLMLVARAVALLRAIEMLVKQGLEEAARPISRSLLETLDLATVVLADSEFAMEFSGDHPDHNEDEFWKRNVGYGRIQKRVEEVWRRAGASDAQVTDLKAIREEVGRSLSGSVHSSISSTLRSYFVPSLRRPGLAFQCALGHISIHAPGLLYGTVSQVHSFGVTTTQLLMSENPPELLKEAANSKQLETMFGTHLTLQELLERLASDLPNIHEIFGPDTDPDE